MRKFIGICIMAALLLSMSVVAYADRWDDIGNGFEAWGVAQGDRWESWGEAQGDKWENVGMNIAERVLKFLRSLTKN